MDSAGWHARHRANKVSPLSSYVYLVLLLMFLPPLRISQDEARWNQPQRGPDGRFQPVEQIYPMDQPFVGGFAPLGSPPTSFMGSPPPLSPPSPAPPPIPPKDGIYAQNNGRPMSMSPRPSYAESTNSFAESTTSGASYMFATQQIAHMSPVERSQNLRVARMQPYLQFMAGPLLRYDTVDADGVWRGAALIVSKYSYKPPRMSAATFHSC